MVENGKGPSPKETEGVTKNESGCITFHGGNGVYTVCLDGSPPPTVSGLPTAQTIFEQDYRVGTNIGSPSNLTASQLKRVAAYNAGLPEGAPGVRITSYKSQVLLSSQKAK